MAARSAFQAKDLQCARLTVPLDYAKPAGDTITLGAGARVTATAAGAGWLTPGRPAVVAAAPGRLDVMGGIADYSGAVVLEGTIGDLAVVALQRREDGRYHLLYDPGIVRAFRAGLLYNVTLWRYWDAIRCPVLLLRGEHSDLLLEATAEEMARRGPKAELVEIPGCGHAPALLDADQIGIVTGWMARTA